MYRVEFIAALLVAAGALVLAMPAHLKEPIKFDLATVLNKTVCPIKVRIDYDPDRVPKWIKVMECQQDPNLWCSQMNIPKYECCQHDHDNARLECVEIQDLVQVSYPKRNEKQMYPVSVGCTCAILENAPLEELHPS